MIELGKRQTLTIVKILDFGAYLKDTASKSSDEEDMVLLPKKEVPKDLEIMDPIEVFVYRDSKDRLIATTRDPYIHIGETATLTVSDVTGFGAFLDWGLEKDLFLPFKEQKGRPSKGDKIGVRLYIDKSKRLCATMWISPEEKKTGDYERNAKKLLGLLKSNNGFLPLTDKSSPEEIKELTGMSKNEFKKSVGNLYKNKTISILSDRIEISRKGH